MKKGFDDYVAKRCERALLDNKDYMKLERSGKATEEELLAMVEVICYKQCFNDFVAIKEM